MISLRTNITQEALKILENKYITKEKLNPFKDIFLKPKNTDLRDFNPNNKILKIRVIGNNAVLSFVLIKNNSNIEFNLYSENENKVLEFAKEIGFEVWGELKLESMKYKLKGGNVFLENFNEIGNFLRIESETNVSLESCINLLNIKDVTKKNQAVLLAEKLNLI